VLEDAIGNSEKVDLALKLVTVVAQLEHNQFIESQELLNND